MVNSRNLLVGSTLTLSMVAIFAYMRKNNLTTNDITLVDACWATNAGIGAGHMNETCGDIQKMGWDWETKVPCYPGFKESEYYYTPREIYGLSGMGRRAKGENEMEQAAKERMDDGSTPDQDDIMFRCAEMRSDPDFSSDIPMTQTVEATEERENWWRRSPPPCQDRPDANGNYKACSVSLAFDNTDEAECSGLRSSSGPVPYCYCNWTDRDNKEEHWLNRGCVRHDMCLEGVGSVTDAGLYCCDRLLRSAAWTCGWKPWACDDSSVKAVAVSGSMFFGGHDSGCDSSKSFSDSHRMCYGSGCGRR